LVASGFDPRMVAIERRVGMHEEVRVGKRRLGRRDSLFIIRWLLLCIFHEILECETGELNDELDVFDVAQDDGRVSLRQLFGTGNSFGHRLPISNLNDDVDQTVRPSTRSPRPLQTRPPNGPHKTPNNPTQISPFCPVHLPHSSFLRISARRSRYRAPLAQRTQAAGGVGGEGCEGLLGQ
jgi:hypothetical protein